MGIVASFCEDGVFEEETCQKSGGFHHLGKNSSEEGRAACEANPVDLALFFALLTPVCRKGRGDALRGLPVDENHSISGRFPLEKRLLAGPPQKVAYAAKGRAWVRWRSRLGRLPLPWENLVESEIDKPAEKVHEGVDRIGGAEMQDARS